MTKTSLDHYFELLDSDTGVDGINELFTENALAIYGGEVARGHDWIGRLHRSVIGRRKSSRHEWTIVEKTRDRLVAQWQESGVDLHDKEFTASGRAVTSLDDTGRISDLRLSFESGTDRIRVILGRHLEAFALEDPDDRREVIAQVYHEDVRFFEADKVSVFTGRAEIAARTDQVLTMAQPLLAQIDGVMENHHAVLWQWTIVNPIAGEARGWEVVRLDGDQIREFVVFTEDADTLVEGMP
ncbi:hypothetical protein LWC34_05980 [Kibdelosporangium philippinense]|uniref:SnoaL-like domain-containing protein n=1 Tax=Kibdelosporangium philippinense TaxID=211113 RepID=A0ABS8Z6W8_9PSEU|nr:hypothetical protein [Kibdelosporangium philippinense]MCE7002381.1 hypothetical protein [Kibdelosporangium philippinense]